MNLSILGSILFILAVAGVVIWVFWGRRRDEKKQGGS